MYLLTSVENFRAGDLNIQALTMNSMTRQGQLNFLVR